MILLARHGETTYNAERRFQGHSARAVLTDLGIEQARELAEEEGASGAGVIVTGSVVTVGEARRLLRRTSSERDAGAGPSGG